MSDSAMSGLWWLAFLLGLDFLPAIIAVARGLKNQVSVILLNVFLGWSAGSARCAGLVQGRQKSNRHRRFLLDRKSIGHLRGLGERGGPNGGDCRERRTQSS